jgi:type I restriction enzyme S subunit
MSKLPMSWTAIPLGQEIEFKKGKKPEFLHGMPNENFVPYVDIKAFEKGNIRQYADKNSGVIAETNDTLMVWDGARSGLVGNGIAGVIGSTLMRIRPKSSDRNYLHQFLKYKFSQINSNTKGTGIPHVSPEFLFGIDIPLGPLPEQKRISDKLDTILARVDVCRNRIDRIPAMLKRFRQSVLAAATSGKLTKDWRELNGQPVGQARDEVLQRLILRREKTPSNKKFKEPSVCDLTHWGLDLPSTWSVESVSAYAECLDHLRIPVTRDKRANTHGLYPYYGANGQVDMVDEYLFDDELVLVTEDETFYGREKPIAYRTSGRCWVNNHAHVLLAGDRSRADYLCYALMYYDVLPWLTGTTGRAKLTQGVLNSLPMAVPPQTELLEIVRRVESLFAYADRLEARYTAARAQVEKLTPATLAKAFRGELVPQDPNDEPASVLLERIRTKHNEESVNKHKRGNKARKQK